MSRPYVLGSVGDGTLREELNRRGYTDHASDRPGLVSGRRDIRRNGRTVARLDANDCWSWLARLDRKVSALRGGL